MKFKNDAKLSILKNKFKKIIKKKIRKINYSSGKGSFCQKNISFSFLATST